MATTFGTRPEDTVADSRGNVLSGVVLTLYATKADALAQTSPVTTVTTNSHGLWSYSDSSARSGLFVRDPAGNVWAVDSEEAGASVANKVNKGEIVIMVADYASAQAAVDAAPSGATVRFSGTAHTLTAAVSISKPLTVDSTTGTQITQTTAGAPAFNVTSGGVAFRGLRMTGAQYANLVSNEVAINANGTVGSYLQGVRVERCQFDNWGHTAVWVQFANDVDVADNKFNNIAYAGVLLLSVTRGSVSRNTVTNIIQGVGAVNSYGIAVTRSQGDLATYPRSTDVMVSGNRIDGVTSWEGLDTHGGQRITFSGNTVKNCKTGIAIVGSTDAGAAVSFAPLDISVSDNIVDSGVTDGSRGIGIAFVGATSGAVGTPTELATGTIQGNTVRGHGTESGSTSGAIVAYVTRGLVISGNVLIEPAPSGVCLQYDNYGFACSNNTVRDAWSNTAGIATVVCVSSNYNSGRIDSMQAIRGAKSATLVFSQGIRLASNDPSVAVSLGRNDVSIATTPLSDAGARTVGGIDANNLGFYGATPVAKAGSTQDLKTSLVNLGLITGSGATPLSLNGGALIAKNITSTGHLLNTGGTAPSIAAAAGAGSSPPTPTFDAGQQDCRGSVNLGTGTSATAGDQVTVTYGTAWGANPDVVIAPLNAATAALQPYVSAHGTGNFKIAFGVAPASSQTVGTYKLSYLVIGS
jgi:hypothetical protein